MSIILEWFNLLQDFLRRPKDLIDWEKLKMPREEIPVILLAGPSGSGKSSFLKRLTKEYVEISSNESEKPCTKECKAYTISVQIHGIDQIFIIIDTPGLQDQTRSDDNQDTLKKINAVLKNLEPLKVTGAIFFHNLSAAKLSGNTLFDLDIFMAICGKKFAKSHVAFVTTHWDYLKSTASVIKMLNERHTNARKQIAARYPNLYSNLNPIFFKRLRDDADSCQEVLTHFLDTTKPYPPPQLQLLKEMSSGGLAKGSVKKTTAGQTTDPESRLKKPMAASASS